MENLKIRVSTAEERKEAMVLFENLGGMRSNSATDDRIGIVAMEFGEIYVDDSCHWGAYDGKETTLDQLRQMVADKTQQSKDLKHGGELISGADALRAIADGKEVEVYMEIPNKLPKTKGWVDASICSLVAFAFISPSLSFKFRLKPSTIKIELEIPAPFEPKEGERYWWINPNAKMGYAWDSNDLEQTDFNRISMGVYRTEEDVVKVVAALRSILSAKP